MTLVLLAVEVGIALFVHDTIVRPFVGDVLVVVLIYGFLQAVSPRPYPRMAAAVLLLACGVEVLQYFDYVKVLHLENKRVLSTALGRTFAWNDFLAYFTGYLLIRFFDRSPGCRNGAVSLPRPPSP